ncbi:hypothetical protein L2E82_48955 [Cichorium intybus]|uniref:Uncharacterized protein n=1 Tax=Cichorium intybus TaxID=13427 RepID=A0ACB8YZF3_CICIN|nr:hypothetical protein L2E82_48955 [Cichorium intybus]
MLNYTQGSNEYVRRIDDAELDDDDDISRETSQVGSKKQKVSQEVSDTPTDYLQKQALKMASGSIVLKSSTVKFSVVKKASEKEKKIEEDKEKTTSDVLLLCQQCDSDEE